MDALVVDSDSKPRAYRILEQATGSAGAVPFFTGFGLLLAGFGGWMIWKGLMVSGIGHAMPVSWLSWCFSQFQMAIMGAVGMAALLGGLALSLLIVMSQVIPTYTTWRLDGSGLYGTSGVGGLRLGTAEYVPFASINAITQSDDRVQLYLRPDGTGAFERNLASGLTTQEAARLAACFQEDLAAARAQWAQQGLMLDPHLAGHAPGAAAAIHPA